MRRIRDGLYILESGGWANSYLIEGARGFTLVDTGHPRCAEALIREIADSGFDLWELEQIVLTHGHFDHAGGAGPLMRRRRVKVLVHPGDAPAVAGKARLEPRSLAGLAARLVQRWRYPCLPVETVVAIQEGESLRPLPHWQVLDTPGHTSGSISLYQPTEKLLICGDALHNWGGKLRLFPAGLNQDHDAAVKTAARLAQLGVDVLCCGHGPPVLSAACVVIDDMLRK